MPAVKKAISDIVTTGIDMILYGEAGRSKKNGTASKVSYRNYYDQGTDRVRAGSVGNRRNTPDYDDILFDTRGDAEAVLDAMNDIISQYGTVSVSDFYDLARVPNNKRRTFDQVPEKFKADVEAKLLEYGYDTNGDPIAEEE